MIGFLPFGQEEIFHNVHFHERSTLLLALRAKITNAVVFVNDAVGKQFAQSGEQEFVSEAFHGHIYGINTVRQCQMAHSFGFVANGQYDAFAAVGGDITGRPSGIAVEYDGPQSCRSSSYRL